MSMTLDYLPVRHLGIEVDDALEMAEENDIWRHRIWLRKSQSDLRKQCDSAGH